MMKVNSDILEGININFHASIRIATGKNILYIDPYKITTEHSLNDADYIFITHSHYDHFSEDDIKKVLSFKTRVIAPVNLQENLLNIGIDENNILLVKPGNSYKLGDISFDTIASYNINKNYHKKEYNWVGYNILLNNKRYYIVGDSDIIPEMNDVYADILFVPVGGTYTMNYKEAATLTNKLKPKYAIPIHYGEVGSVIDANKFIENINKDIKGIVIER